MSGFYGSFYQMMAVGQAQAAANRSENRTLDLAQQLHMTNDRLDRMMLICLAMWKLVQEKTGLTDEDLQEMAKKLDLADGKADGKITPVLRTCPKCGRPVNGRHPRCMYCGAELPNQTVFGDAL